MHTAASARPLGGSCWLNVRTDSLEKDTCPIPLKVIRGIETDAEVVHRVLRGVTVVRLRMGT
jgi:hypothetical protein